MPAKFDRLPLRVEAQHADRAIVSLEQPEQHPDRRRLAGRIATEKCKRAAALDSQRYTAQHVGRSKRFKNGLHFNGWVNHDFESLMATASDLATLFAASARSSCNSSVERPSPVACRAICRSSSTSRARWLAMRVFDIRLVTNVPCPCRISSSPSPQRRSYTRSTVF